MLVSFSFSSLEACQVFLLFSLNSFCFQIEFHLHYFHMLPRQEFHSFHWNQSQIVHFFQFFETKFREKVSIFFFLHCECGFAKQMFSILGPQIIVFNNLIDVRACCFGHFNSVIEFVSLCRFDGKCCYENDDFLWQFSKDLFPVLYRFKSVHSGHNVCLKKIEKQYIIYSRYGFIVLLQWQLVLYCYSRLLV